MMDIQLFLSRYDDAVAKAITVVKSLINLVPAGYESELEAAIGKQVEATAELFVINQFLLDAPIVTADKLIPLFNDLVTGDILEQQLIGSGLWSARV